MGFIIVKGVTKVKPVTNNRNEDAREVLVNLGWELRRVNPPVLNLVQGVGFKTLMLFEKKKKKKNQSGVSVKVEPFVWPFCFLDYTAEK